MTAMVLLITALSRLSTLGSEVIVRQSGPAVLPDRRERPQPPGEARSSRHFTPRPLAGPGQLAHSRLSSDEPFCYCHVITFYGISLSTG